MKFEKFIKKAVPYVSTVMYRGEAWCKCGKTYARIPEHLGHIGLEDKSDKILAFAIDGEYGPEAELVKAFLDTPDGKSKDIIRVFSDGQFHFDVKNELFGLIERYDQLFISEVDTDDGYSGLALLVGKPVPNPDDFEPDFIITDITKNEEEEE